ncbi:translation initiation factor IF-2 [Oliverpabstia intestinalis]|uniref:translation initiation factor IF-2 n=1 Tax=Oliverpabstia intestinalis TaxID=2606633 RepID=UPI003F88655D
MPKSRIYEIAQELNKTNKEVIEFLKEKKVEVKSHMSTLEEKDEKMVRDAFTGKNEGKEEKKEAADRPKKKSNLIQVFRPQNAQTQEGKNFRRNKPQSDRNGHDRPARGNGEGNRSGYQNRDNQSRDGQERRFNGQGRRDNQNRDGQSRDNQGGRRFDNRNGQNNNRYQGQNNRQDGGNGSRRFDGNRDGQNRDNQNRDNQGGRRFDNNRNGMNRDNRERDGRENNGRRNERRDSRPAMDSMDLGLARKPVRDVKNKEKDKEKEREREEKKTQDRRNGQGSNRPNQGRFQKSRLPKALQKPARPQPKEEKKEVVKEITLPEKMTIRELAEKMKMQPAVIVKKLFMEGTMVTVNHEIDFEKAQEIALDYDIIAEQEEKVDVIEELLKEEEEDPKDLVPRPPVVCVMGHVDHGKTSLLDAIRKTNVTDREAGGITQHIGAYVVSIKGQKITFLDTPGHEAFTAMRMRGANSTDIAVLVVAADDGVMPQTVEAINHAKAAGVEIIVAINKVDKPSANIERVKQELSEYELIPEDWGGSTIFVPVSAKTHQGIEELLEMILLTSEVCELKANPKRKARGLVIEAQLDKGKGPVATILVQKGTLHVGDFIAAGASSGKVRAMMDDKGRRVKEAGPSTPVEILGLSDVPNAGEVLVATENDKEAKNFAATFISENKNRLLEETKAKMSLDDLFSQIQEGNLKELNLIVKADVQGSVEAVKQSLVKLSNDEVVVKVIHGGVGAINESDVTLASASNAIIIGFNVRPDATAKATAEQEGVDLRLYRVIYQAIEDVEAAMKGMLDPVFEEKVIGHAEVRQIFKASGVGNIAGSYVLDGVFQRGCTVRISREGKQIFEGPLASLKRFKDDVKEVKAGYECGLVFEGFNDIQELDQVEAYIMVEVPR